MKITSYDQFTGIEYNTGCFEHQRAYNIAATINFKEHRFDIIDNDYALYVDQYRFDLYRLEISHDVLIEIYDKYIRALLDHFKRQINLIIKAQLESIDSLNRND